MPGAFAALGGFGDSSAAAAKARATPASHGTHLLLPGVELAGLLEGGFLGMTGSSPTTDPRSELLRLTGRRD